MHGVVVSLLKQRIQNWIEPIKHIVRHCLRRHIRVKPYWFSGHEWNGITSPPQHNLSKIPANVSHGVLVALCAENRLKPRSKKLRCLG